MSTSTRYENANFLRELAETLPNISAQQHKPEQVQLLQRLADEELAQARHDEWVRGKVAAARADNRPGMTIERVRELLVRQQDGRSLLDAMMALPAAEGIELPLPERKLGYGDDRIPNTDSQM
ncbi:MAG: hypothetical protein Q4D91_13890 [Lautropia sp.]|nr:hypothetical protein [Lautropia sp.]